MKLELDTIKAAMDHQAKMFSERVKLVDVEVKTDAADAQRDIDAMQGQEEEDGEEDDDDRPRR
jgi:hypothetical protein